MKTLALFSVAVVSCGVFAHAFAENKWAPEVLSEVTLDIDNDGKMDRAVLVEEPGRSGKDLYIYLAVGDEKLDLSRKPTFLKKEITTEEILAFESKGKGSLVVEFGWIGGDRWRKTLTIVDRGGKFLVAGFANDWDLREDGIGTCDINFLSGKGVSAKGWVKGQSSGWSYGNRGWVKGQSIRRKFTPVKLADWSEDRLPKECK